jgi:hypothetical protein
MLHKASIALIVEATSQFAGQTQTVIGLPQQQRTAVGREGAAGKIDHDFASAQVLK